MKTKKPIELDGRTGEGGGQVVRIACALAAVTSQPIRITDVRGNRGGARGGAGLKAQHVSSIQWLAQATGAKTQGLSIGSKTLEFAPSVPPTSLKERKFKIAAESSAASALLIFQAVFPYLLFAGNEAGKPIELEILGGTNVSFSLSYEYLDQVLLPTLEAKFGVSVERKLRGRSWSVGPKGKGAVWFKIQPLKKGEILRLREAWERPVVDDDLKVKKIDVSILAPYALHEHLQEVLVRDLDVLFPDVDINFVVVEESGHDARMYALLVAHSETGLRWGRDFLYDQKHKNKTPEKLSTEISRKISKDLFEEIAIRGVVDEYLQDQLVVFQALAEGRTSFPRAADRGGEDNIGRLDENVAQLETSEKRMRKDRTQEPFGEGSMHTTTARWVAAELLPQVQWFNKGSICKGAGISFK
ncbi:RNA 3'-terminal phosphate cyclase-domain-containing protein [Xylariales sp. AK1849]|nr:RNA 3'-terminal phosphate cyclase-domain-containing protein [Xylariales sp. AK1849]